MPLTAPRLKLETPLSELEWLGTPRLRALQRLGCENVGDVLERYPKRYEDRRQFDRFPSNESDTAVCVCGLVKKTNLRRFRGSQRMFDAVMEEEGAHAL